MIPYEDLNEGSRIALDNARKLSEAMNFLYDKKSYDVGVILGSLALEELGKHHYLSKNYNSKNPIQENDKIFRDHEYKLDMLLDYYKREDNDQTIKELKKDFRIYKKFRFQLLYAEWNSNSKKWNDSSGNKYATSYMRDIIDILIIRYLKFLGGDMDLLTKQFGDLIKLLVNEKIFFRCKNCSYVINKAEEIFLGCKCEKRQLEAYWVK